MLLNQNYFQSQNVLHLAKDLLGKVLYTNIDGKVTSGIIVETEAYKAPEDKASHAYNNRKTQRTATMFMNGGHAYVYLCYGIHQMFNVVTATEGIAHAILIRAIQPHKGIQHMLSRRSMDVLKPTVTRGPGSLAQALGIHTNYNAIPLFKKNGPIRIYDEQITFPEAEIGISKRIGVEYAGESANLPYRFFLKNNEYVSRLIENRKKITAGKTLVNGNILKH